ncbi:MAG: DNA alkylation repair protein [Clostridia bacterium]|nr:DNA alkylation repair protein [Clostridia bacterium]
MRSVELNERLFLLSDEKFKKFNSSLIPNIDPEYIIGVKTPQLKSIAKELYKSDNYKEFLLDLPHKYFEENQIHDFIIAEFKDFDKCIIEVERFLPYIDNWATCDQLSPKVFVKHKPELLEYINRWTKYRHTYTVRFAVNMLMRHFLEDDFSIIYADMVAEISIDDYYVNMVRAWYFATALAKQWESVLPYLEDKKLDVWTHNKTIQKSVESLRISKEQKEYLKTLKIKTG